MHKNQFIKYAGFFGAFALSVIIAGAFVVPEFSQQHKTSPQKAADIMPTLPAPKIAMLTSSTQIVFVPRVVDGDTIVVEPVDAITGEPGKQETVRYIGMDTPETVSPTKPVECYGHEASAHNKALVDGKYVAIVRDAGDRDKYGRLLRYVYLLGDTSSLGTTTTFGAFINLELVKDGFARALTITPNTEFATEFKAAAATAKSSNLGFWSACASYPFG